MTLYVMRVGDRQPYFHNEGFITKHTPKSYEIYHNLVFSQDKSSSKFENIQDTFDY